MSAKFTKAQIAAAKRYAGTIPPTAIDPRIEALVTKLIGRVADKWTMLVLEVLAEKGTRFSRLAKAIGDISQKMLTQTLRAMDRDGLIDRTVFPIVPPKVEYPDETRLHPRRCLLRCMDMGRGKPVTGRASTVRVRHACLNSHNGTPGEQGRPQRL